jgi:serine/threonine protein kinase
MSEKLGRYEILEEIGQGGFAIVYRGRDTELDRLVALKELRPILLHDTTWVKHFRREARTIARLDHPRIVTIHDIYEAQKRLFIVMHLVGGPSLEELIATRGPLPWSEAVKIITAVAEGLDYAHTQSILHRDLKPANILLDPERGPLLSDFGFAKLAGESSISATASGGVVGTPHYIAPEVWEGQGTTRQSDIYALGCILYEILTGEKSFKGETPPAVMMAHFRPPAIPEVWPEGVPSGVSEVLATALAKKPTTRYGSVGEMAQALVSLAEGEPKPVEPDRASQQTVAPKGDGPDAARKQRQPDQPDEVDLAPETRDQQANPWDGVWDAEAEAPAKPRGPEERWPGFFPGGGPASIKGRRFRHKGSEERWRGFFPGGGPTSVRRGRSRHKGEEEETWRDFLSRHLGPYVIVISILGVMNLLTSSYPWFLWPALGWGIGLALRAFKMSLARMTNLSGKWRGFVGHLGPYLIVIGMLGVMNLLTSSYPWFLWPALGWGIGLALHLWGTILGKDEDEERAEPRTATEHGQAQARPVKRSTKKAELADPAIQAHLEKARAYKEQIDNLVKSTSDKDTHIRLQDLADQVSEWAQAIEELAKRVDRFQQNTLIHQDLETVPQSIKKLEAQLANETDEATRAELKRTLANRRNQLAALERLRSIMKRAEIKIESTLSSLGTIYPQILTSQSTDYVADYHRLSAEVDEEVRTLQDHLEVLEEVKLGSV